MSTAAAATGDTAADKAAADKVAGLTEKCKAEMAMYSRTINRFLGGRRQSLLKRLVDRKQKKLELKKQKWKQEQELEQKWMQKREAVRAVKKRIDDAEEKEDCSIVMEALKEAKEAEVAARPEILGVLCQGVFAEREGGGTGRAGCYAGGDENV
jgi:hypothetical protein